MMPYRCPVDDVVFTPQNIDRAPTLEGHPECPGPACRKKFAGYKGAAQVVPIVAPAPAANNAGGGAGVTALDHPPLGQGW